MGDPKLSRNTRWTDACLEGGSYGIEFCEGQRRPDVLDWRFVGGLA